MRTFRAGKCEGTLFVDGHPLQIDIVLERGTNREISLSLDHRDLADLEHVVKRLRNAARTALPDRYKSEVD